MAASAASAVGSVASAAGSVTVSCAPQAVAAKEAGNKAFAAERYQEAYDHYCEAIRLDPASALLRSNRAGALASLGRHAEALEDAELCVQLQPHWWKGYSRRGHAQFQLGRYADSEASFSVALKLNPQEKSVSDALEQAAEKRRSFEAQGLRGAAASSSGPPQSGAMPAAPAPPASSLFTRLSEEEVRKRLERGAEQLSDAELDAELRKAGIEVGQGACRAEKVQLYLRLDKEFGAAGAPVAQAKAPPEAPPKAAGTRGERLLEQRRRWLEQWEAWDDARLLQRLRQLGLDAEGACRADLIELLLQAETERLERKRCTPRRLQMLALCAAVLCILGTFVGVALALALGRG